MNMAQMFRNAASFNQPLADWDTSSLSSVIYMFQNAAAFNQVLKDWDTGSLSGGGSKFMFMGATAFLGANTNCGLRKNVKHAACTGTSTTYDRSESATSGPPKAWEITPPSLLPPPSPPASASPVTEPPRTPSSSASASPPGEDVDSGDTSDEFADSGATSLRAMFSTAVVAVAAALLLSDLG
jgi:hypothetical protein